jgi:LuxR family maltose regulon positive regulatory protein
VLDWLDNLVQEPRAANPVLRRVGAAAALAHDAGSGAARWLPESRSSSTSLRGADAAITAMTALREGRLTEASRLGAIATMTGGTDGPWWPALGSLARGTAFLWSGRLDDARTTLRIALDAAQSTDYRFVLGRAREALTACAFLGGASDDEIRRAVSSVPRESMTPLTRCLHALANAGRGGAGGLEDAVAAARALDDGEPHAAAAAWCIVANLALLVGDGTRSAHARNRAWAALSDCEAGSLLEELLPAPDPAAARTRFMTAREHVVLRALHGSLSVREIAAELNLSHNTVKSHIRTIFRKLGVHDRRAAVAAARERGLLPSAAFRKGCPRLPV